MGVTTHDIEMCSSVPCKRMFKAFILEIDAIFAKIMPEAVNGVQILQGDGGAGTIKLISYQEDGKSKSVKHRVDAIDKEKLTYSYTIIEGDALIDVVESISYDIKIESSADGGSVCKMTSKFHTKGDAKITEDQLNVGKEKASGMFKAIEGYLLANPDACN